MQYKKKAYTIAIIAFLTLSMVLATIPMASATVTVSVMREGAKLPSGVSAIELDYVDDGVAEWTTAQRYSGLSSAKLSIPTSYSASDVARVVASLTDLTLNDITGGSYWYYVDPSTPATSIVYKGFIKTEMTSPNLEPSGGEYADYDVYGAPYLIIELDADDNDVADTWVIQTKWAATENVAWAQDVIETAEPFHVATLLGASPFPIDTNWGTLAEVKAASVGVYALADAAVLKVKIAIGEWNPLGPCPPNGPVVAFVDLITIGTSTITVDLEDPAVGNVGDTVTVSGTCTSPGGLIKVYWDSVKTWDGKAGLLEEDYAVGFDYEIDITIPEAKAGGHLVIVKDVEAADIASAPLIVEPEIVLTPDVGIIGDTITVTGTGFAADSEITLSGFVGLTIDTVPSKVTTSSLGSFTCEFDIPEKGGDENPLVDDDYDITATDAAGNSASDTLTVGKYITLTPKKGLVGTTVTVAGRGFTAEGTVDIRWYMNGGYITIIDDYDIDENGDFSTTFNVPLVPDPEEPGTPYSVLAIDSENKDAWATFTVVEEASIELDPDEARPEKEFTVSGEWFTEDSEVTITFNGEELDTVVTDEVGSFSVDVEVPEDAEPGDYTVTATDEEGVTASATFTVLPPPVIEIRTRATEYLRGDTISIYGNCSEPQDAVLWITDPDGVWFWGSFLYDDSWADMDGWYALPYLYGGLETALPLGMWPLPSDAPLGDWNFTAYALEDFDWEEMEGDILDTNLFTVVKRPTLATILNRLDELDVKLSGLITDSEGNLEAYIDTSLGPVIASLDEINTKLVSIESGIATINTTVGEIKVSIDALDLSAIDAKLTSITGTLVTVSTSIGDVQTTLEDLDAKLVSLDGDVATISTKVGDVKTSLSDLDTEIVSLGGDVVSIKTKVGTIEGKVTSIDNGVATIRTDVGTVKADASTIKENTETIPDAISAVTTPIWIAVILSLIAAAAAIAAVVTINRKIAG